MELDAALEPQRPRMMHAGRDNDASAAGGECIVYRPLYLLSNASCGNPEVASRSRERNGDGENCDSDR
jgi:hypothetical protein